MAAIFQGKSVIPIAATMRVGLIQVLERSGRSMSIQQRLSTLRSGFIDPDWENQPNTWLRNLNSRHINDIAVRLIHGVVGGTRSLTNSTAHKIWAGSRLIDVKVATMSRINNHPALAWRNIHLPALYTHLALVAIYPKSARAFIIPLEDIPASALGAVKGSLDHFQIVTTRPFELFSWMELHEITGAL